jgi:hypothetical protein
MPNKWPKRNAANGHKRESVNDNRIECVTVSLPWKGLLVFYNGVREIQHIPVHQTFSELLQYFALACSKIDLVLIVKMFITFSQYHDKCVLETEMPCHKNSLKCPCWHDGSTVVAATLLHCYVKLGIRQSVAAGTPTQVPWDLATDHSLECQPV